MNPAIVELRERLSESKDFKKRVADKQARTGCPVDLENALNREVDYYVSEGYFVREMVHMDKLTRCQYDDGRCVICGGFELENPHPNFR